MVIDPMLGHCGNILFVERGNFSFIRDLSINLFNQVKTESEHQRKEDCRKIAMAQYWFDKFENDRSKFIG